MGSLRHVAFWTDDLERLRSFYVRYFGATANDKYVNSGDHFESYFLDFGQGARLEIMHMPSIPAAPPGVPKETLGYSHIAIGVGSEAQVDTLTDRLRADGFEVASEPRRTGDGYYESVVLDPDGNRVEITV